MEFTDEISYWVLCFEVAALELIQSMKRKENNILKLEELVKEIIKLSQVIVPIIERTCKEERDDQKI